MELLTVKGKKNYKSKIFAPASKSYSHRMILSAAMCEKPSRIDNVMFSKDILATLSCIKQMGAKVFEGDTFVEILKGDIPKTADVFCNESASTLRFIIPILGVNGINATVTGTKKLMERPLDVYTEIFTKNNIKFEYKKGEFFKIKSPILGGEFDVRGDISSQFITGLLYALCNAHKPSKINLTTPLLSKPYVDITLDVLKKSGIVIKNNDYQSFEVSPNQTFLPISGSVPGDFSQSCPFIAAGLFDGNVEITNLDIKSLQGDKKIVEYCKMMGGKIDVFPSKISVSKSSLKSNLTFDISNCPDIAPVFSIICAHAAGTTTLIGTNRLKIKECDRSKAIVETLTKLGINAYEGDDFIKIYGEDKILTGGKLSSFNDHRMAMALCCASIICNNKITFDKPDCIKKSYPTFYDDFSDFATFIK